MHRYVCSVSASKLVTLATYPDESVREEMGSDRRFGKKGGSPEERPGSPDGKRERIGEKMVRQGEKRVRYGEKKGDRCLVINSHWTSATKAPPSEQVATFSSRDNICH